MHYLLWEQSEFDYASESFILLQTEASEELVKRFVKEYFLHYTILLTAKDVTSFQAQEIDVKTFREDEINAWFHYKQVKEETEEKQNRALLEHLKPWDKEMQEAVMHYKLLNVEEKIAIFKYVEPEEVTKELVENMRELGYEQYKLKNEKVRFRNIHHAKIREEFEEKRTHVKEQLRNARKRYNDALNMYKDTHDFVTFEPIQRYTRR